MKLTIEKMDYEGRGVAHNEEKVCFVKNALPNEVVEGKLLKDAKNFSIYETEKILEKNSYRINSICPNAINCENCPYSFVNYEYSLELKKESLKDLLKKNKIEIPNLEIVASPNIYDYRNKISLKIKNKQFGYYKEETHDFVPIKNCKLAKKAIQDFLNDFSLLNIINGEIVIRCNENDELMLIIKTEESPKIAKEIIEKHKIAGIIWNNKCAYNYPYFFERINHTLYKVDATSFFQVNSGIAQKIIDDVMSYINKDDIVYDLYCGVGFFSLQVIKKAKEVIGIELNQKAILNAIFNANLNNLTNVSFHVGKVEDVIEKIPINGNTVIIDPPRSGLHQKVIDMLNKNNFAKIIYISCNPKTLVRDLKKLEEKYEIKQIKAYDMFSYTKHLETICLLKLR